MDELTLTRLQNAAYQQIEQRMEEIYRCYQSRSSSPLCKSADKIKKVALISTPRCGSKLLCELMFQHKLGNPKEFFNSIYEDTYQKIAQPKPTSFEEYYNQIIIGSYNEQTNIFSINFHARHMREKIESGVSIDDLGIDYFLNIQRKDIIAQAYSYAKASMTHIWEHDIQKQASIADNEINVNISLSELKSAIKRIKKYQKYIKKVFGEKNINIKTIYYEDIASDNREDILKQVCSFIDVPYTAGMLPPKIKKQQTTSDSQQIGKLTKQMKTRGIPLISRLFG